MCGVGGSTEEQLVLQASALKVLRTTISLLIIAPPFLFHGMDPA